MPRLAAASSATGVRRSAARRAGFTLPEMMVTITLLGIVMATVLNLLNRQQRFYRSANEIVDARSQLRQAATLLPFDLRGISSTGKDIVKIDPTKIGVVVNFGSAIICDRIASSANQFDIPPLDAAENVYTTWTRKPTAGDSVFIFDENVKRGAEDDRWLRFSIEQMVDSLTTYCPTGTGPTGIYTTTADATKRRHRIKVKLPGTLMDGTPVAAIPTTVVTGAAVRFEHPQEYSLYKPSGETEGRWYLGMTDWKNGAWTTVAPVSGPYRAGDGTAAASGLQFRYFTDTGTELSATSNPALVARIDMMVRTRGTDTRNVISQGAAGVFDDSLAARVAIRNRQ